jgi:hypothetical protein
MRRAPVIVILALLSLIPARAADALTLYVRRVVVMDRGPIALRSLVQSSGDVSAGLKETLDRSIGEVTDKILLIPSTSYKGLFDKGPGENLILVGTRTIVAPKGLLQENELAVLDKLADYMESQGLLGQESAEMESVRVTGISTESAGDAISFKQVRVDRKGGLASGTVEYSFQNPGSGAGRIALKIRQDEKKAMAAASGIKANEAVAVLFKKGSIVIEMNGKALASAREGDRVSVYVPDSRMNFTGIVLANKAVSVEIN